MNSSKARNFLMILAGFCIVVAVYYLFINDSGPAPGEDPANLLGTWERTDYPYKIIVSSFKEDGSLEATYLNPQPINVGTAKWEVYDHKLYMYIELQDVNYPGSNYNLIFDANTEKFSGTYFQAVAGETYNVEFSRER